MNTALSKKRCSTPRERREFWTAMLFISPFIVGFLAFTLVPTIQSLIYSFCEYSIMGSPKWTGLTNFSKLFKDAKFYTSLKNTLYMVVFGVPLTNIFALLLAVLLNKQCPLKSVFRAMIYVPSVMPAVAVTLVFAWILNPEYGLVNSILETLGIPGPGWMADAHWSKPALLIMSVWCCGNTMVMYMAALQDVSHELYEAAQIDGANSPQQFLHVTVPGIKPVIIYNTIMSLIGYMNYFTQAYVANTTSSSGAPSFGAPLNSTLFLSTYLYQNGFSFYKIGYASAIAWVLLVITMIFTLILFKTSGMFKAND